MEFEIGVDGPGEVHLWSTGSLGDVVSLLVGGGTGLPGTIVAPFPAHTHANWAFTQPGAYTFTVRADGHVGDGVLSSPTRTYTWEVGDPAEPTPTPTATEEPTEEPTSEPTEEPTPEPTPTTEPPASPQPTTPPTVRPTTKPTPSASRRPTPSATPSAGAGITPSASPSAARVECRPVTVTTKGTGSADGR